MYIYTHTTFLGIYLGVALLGHIVTTFSFLMYSCLLKVAARFYIPRAPERYEGSDLFTCLLTLIIVHVFDYSCYNEYEIVFHCDFDEHLPHD